MAKAIGIDPGSTNSAVAATMEGGQSEVVANEEAARVTPPRSSLRQRPRPGGRRPLRSGTL